MFFNYFFIFLEIEKRKNKKDNMEKTIRKEYILLNQILNKIYSTLVKKILINFLNLKDFLIYSKK